MAGRPKGTQARTKLVQVRMTPTGREMLEKARGTQTISDYVRDLVAADVKKRGVR